MNHDLAIRSVLELVIRDRQDVRTHYVFVDSPPGAGKTELIELVAATATYCGLRVGIACPRAEQTFDLVRRLLAAYPDQAIQLKVGQGRVLPADLRRQVRSGEPHGFALGPPRGRSIDVGTVGKFGYLPAGTTPYDLLLCDEAYQVTLADFTPLLLQAERFLLVGDPGQLPPLVLIDSEPFHAASYRVHAPAPVELLRHAPGSPVVKLGVTYRLPPDSATIIQQAMYPALPFQAAATLNQRRLTMSRTGHNHDAVDRALELLVAGASLVVLVLPAAKGTRSVIDAEATALMADVIARIFTRQVGPAGGRPFTAKEIGCVDSHVASGAALRRTLQQRGIAVGALMIDTPEVWQGLQRAMMVVRHPIGDPLPSAFDLEPGRFCVALTRHQFGCIVVARAAIDQVLQRYHYDSGARPLGGPDRVSRGLEMHRRLWEALRRSGRLIRA